MSMPRVRLAAVVIAAFGIVLSVSQARAQSNGPAPAPMANPSAVFSGSTPGVVMQGGHTTDPAMMQGQPIQSAGWHQGGDCQGGACFAAPQESNCLFGDEPCDKWKDRWYVSVSGGWAHRNKVHEMVDDRTFIKFNEGFAANAALGYRFGGHFRLEAEYSFMNTSVDQAGAGAGPFAFASDATGNVNLRAFMINGYTDVQLGNSPWLAYFGAGIGIYQSELNSLYPAFFATPGLPAGFATTPVNCTSDMPMAWQLRAGVTRLVGERTELYAGYRYFRGDTLTFASAPFAGPATPTFAPNGAVVHGIELGVRVGF